MSDPILLKAGAARAQILPERGGLLSHLSLEDPFGKTRQVLWQPPGFNPDSSGWPGGGMPLLFPFAGRTWADGRVFHYRLPDEDLVTPMPLHGFAYAKCWETIAAGHQEAVLKLTADDASLEIYPFHFEIETSYRLQPRSLSCAVKIHLLSKNRRSAPVAAGFHPYFKWPHSDSDSGALGHLSCEAASALPVTATGAHGKSVTVQQPFDLSESINHNRILGTLRSGEATLVTNKKPDLHVGWSGPIHYLVLWSKEIGRTFCVEPWMGLPDAVHSGLGLVLLDPGDSLELSINMAWR